MNTYKITKQKLRSASRKWMYCAATVMMFMGTLILALPAKVQAYNQVTGRSIEMSSTAAAATNVAYQVGFTTVTNNQTIGSVVVEICGNSPIIGDACNAPAGFNDNVAALSLNNVTGNITGLSISVANSTTNRVVLTRTASAVANGPVTFTLGNGTTNGMNNPSTNATFFARILIFTNTTGSDGGSELNNATDAGGVAISTANQLTVTAKVQEALTFCVYTNATCVAGGTGVTLGDANGVLASNSTTYTSEAKYDVSSNAVSGVSVRMKGNTLTSGSNTLAPAGAACTADPTATNVAMFGIRMSTLGAGQTSTAPYNCLTGNHAFDNNTTTGTASMFGQEIAHTSGATDISTSTIEFAAKSANTSAAGIYTSTLTLIATATY